MQLARACAIAWILILVGLLWCSPKEYRVALLCVIGVSGVAAILFAIPSGPRDGESAASGLKLTCSRLDSTSTDATAGAVVCPLCLTDVVAEEQWIEAGGVHMHRDCVRQSIQSGSFHLDRVIPS